MYVSNRFNRYHGPTKLHQPTTLIIVFLFSPTNVFPSPRFRQKVTSPSTGEEEQTSLTLFNFWSEEIYGFMSKVSWFQEKKIKNY